LFGKYEAIEPDWDSLKYREIKRRQYWGDEVVLSLVD